MVLKRIVEDKRLELDRKYPDRRLPPLEGIEKSDRSFEAALRAPHTGFVFECKKASPSKGLIRADFDPVQIATEYAPFADAISVLTDEKYFQGSLSYLTAVRNAVSVPVLCKDFILEPFQVVEARKAGADAVLLMMSVLSDEEYRQCFETAEALQVDALTEVRDEAELARAVSLGARVIGINNRNLDNLQVDLRATEKLAPSVPKDIVLISESGIETHRDVLRLGPLVNGFLVGSSLMAQPDITRACGELVYGKIKVCGLTENKDAKAVKAAGAAYGGLIFAPGSKRVVTVEEARQVKADVSLDWVGVFVDAPLTEVVDIATELRLAAVQLHGHEDRRYIDALRAELGDGVEVWKAISVGGEIPPLSEFDGARILFDGKEGGSGKPFDWNLLRTVDVRECIVAGGIGVQNAYEASLLGAYALDVNSKIETAPGKKDMHQLAALLRAVRA
ncbi:MAG: bifunctional indole-3-glycerol-phosphate synthase TrpC/phosphoribosylanthranilate isomerase TrpF [Deltaproteobacteria bacterium]|nr:bifunctional indole-3-glycerol-phosphate synthase TrpC/phosphoribosylanthranilate isomerase TrpF [Deltaproteobacteria bacterium]MBN2672554.1 bifunctional indole-3-glycerol-phosphate synthase TrpC/phosphoribosylanthranilate isomerase TrpF [Deltaproteobacteria bacterium]